jgi:uncharacterized repeat protein (TIGR03803 family)
MREKADITLGENLSGIPSASLTVMAVLIVMLASVPGAMGADRYSTLYRFTGGVDGNEPHSSLIFDAEGNLYGTTYKGGTSNDGSVFMLSPNKGGNWSEIVLHSFSNDGHDGCNPWAGLILDPAGNLYGTTLGCGANGNGTVFELTPKSNGSWTESVVHSFNYQDGSGPYAGLVFDLAGNLYGATQGGGNYGFGTIFELVPKGDGSWVEGVLHSFSGVKDGANPYSTLAVDAAGNLYGTTLSGGRSYEGTVFKLTSNGEGSWTETVLHSFVQNGKDGRRPYSDVVFDSAGNLFGTTHDGGAYDWGTIYELRSSGNGIWEERVLHSFNSNGRDGLQPIAGLIVDPAGNIYGPAYGGGIYFFGTVFELKRHDGAWTETVLHSFRDHPGAVPFGKLISDGNGNLYGTTTGDGQKTFGSVFEITR